MLEAEGPVFGHVNPERFIARCSELIASRDPQAHTETMRMVLALGNARIQGMSAEMEDPFLYTPGAQDRLTSLIEQLDATDTITAQEWRLMHDDGAMTVRDGKASSPALLAASLVNLYLYAAAESETLILYVMATGLDQDVAERMSASTITTGIATCLLGNMEKWASVLSRGNKDNFHNLNEVSAESCRFFQATTIKRFAKIRIIDDIESAHEEQAAQNSAIMQAFYTEKSGVLQNNP